MTPAQVTAFGKSPHTVKARSLLCFWAHRRLGMSTIEIARKLRINSEECKDIRGIGRLRPNWCVLLGVFS
jgi:hypothetical protein